MLGRGGFSTVWESLDKTCNERVAVKVLHSELGRDPLRVDRFYRGARIMAELDHEGVIRIVDLHGEDEGYHYFVMELARGGNLRQAVLEQRVGREQLASVIERIGRTLARAHGRGYVHRDVNPGNILLSASGEPKLTDFDLVAAADTTGGTRTGAMGTFVYAAPEQLDRPQDADGRADVYGLAMTAAFILYGHDLPMTVLRDAAGFITTLDCPQPLETVLIRALARERDERFSSMEQFCDALAEAASSAEASEPGALASPRATSLAVDGIPLVEIPAGSLVMGSAEVMGAAHDEDADESDETPAHRVYVSAFRCMVYTVPRGLYADVMGQDPGRPETASPELPVNNVSWFDAVQFCNALSERDGLQLCYRFDGRDVVWNIDADGYRLPTEAEWEYACRAGTETCWSFGNDESQLGEYAWFDNNSNQRPHPVGRKKPNAWGLHDMHGNVWEWCWDWYARYPDRPSGQIDRDPMGPPGSAANIKIVRGGSFAYGAWFLRCALRGRFEPDDRGMDIGFRCVRRSQGQAKE